MSSSPFSNTDLSLEDLPQYSYTTTTPINVKYKYILRIQFGLALLPFVLGILALLIFDVYLPLFIWIISLSLIGLVFGLWIIENELGFKKRNFGLRTHDIYFTKGLIVHKETILPYSRIQHVELKQGILLRQFKLFALKLYTAGASSSDLSIYGLDHDTASKIKAYVMQQNLDLEHGESEV